jgi:hypothetical protein
MANNNHAISFEDDSDVMTKERELPKSAIYTLIDRRNSDFVREGTEKTSNPEYLNAPRLMIIPNTSVMNVMEKGMIKNIPIRHLYGCDTIILKEQQDANVQVIPGNEVDQIVFKNGILIVSPEGDTAPLYKFLESCIDNDGAPNRGKKYPATFRREYPEKEAEKKLIEKTIVAKASTLVSDLYYQNAKGMQFDEPKIDFLCFVLNIRASTYIDKTNVLMDLAREKPKQLIEAFNEKMDQMKMSIAEAFTVGALTYKKEEAILTNNSETTPIYTFEKGTNEDEKSRLLSYFFVGGTDGDYYFNMMLQYTNDIKKAQL